MRVWAGVIAAVVATGAGAQERAPTLETLTVVTDGTVAVGPLGTTVGELDDRDIVREDGQTVGEADEALADSTGTVQAVVVETEAWLGFVERDVVVPLDRLRLQGDTLWTDLTEEEIATLPRFGD